MGTVIGESVFYQIVAILVLASVLGFVAVRFKQPLIVAFIAAGIVSGPDMLNIVGAQNQDFIETLAEFGIALLLFMVGLELDLRLIRSMGRSALMIGIAQIGLTTFVGLALCLALGFSLSAAGLIGLALSFSSTIIAVKLLSDARAVDSLHGRMALGILIVQDIAVILAMIVVTTLAGGEQSDSPAAGDNIAPLVAGVFALFTFAFLFIRYAANPITRILARHSELMTVTCITFAVLMAALCDHLHLSRELGGLLAGMMLASTPYNNVIAARLHVLRDFLLLFFFARLGAHVSFEHIGAVVAPALVLSVFVLVGKPLIVTTVMKAMHFPSRIGFLTGLSLSQISEFSLILVAMAAGGAIIDDRELATVTLVGLLTMGLSSTAIMYGKDLYRSLEKRCSFFQDQKNAHTSTTIPDPTKQHYDIILFGLGRYGLAMAKMLQTRGFSVLGVDFDPDTITTAQESGVPAMYGDAADPEIAESLPLEQAQAVIFSFHHYVGGPTMTDLRRTLAKVLRESGYRGHIATTSHHPEHDHDLSAHGIDIILSPFEDAAGRGVIRIAEALQKDRT